MIALNKLKVADALKPSAKLPETVGEDADFSEIVEYFSSGADLRGIYVVDTDQRMLGVITRIDILDWASAKMGSYLHDTGQRGERTLRVASMVRASTAGEVVHRNSDKASVGMETTLKEALVRMIDLELIVLAIVDAERRVIGELSLSNILAAVIEEPDKDS